jgi:hypothetical protein
MAKLLGLQDGLLARTAAPLGTNGEPVDDQAGDELGGGRGGSTRSRRRRPKPGGKIRGRKFQVPDSVFERLALHAIKKGTNPSAVVTDILDKTLPKHRIETDE